ncbi:MAG: threonylcarbamoyl-AMP synthase, partial [Flavobacteriaceae bacterium]|nr:threonylcarbamoyl-AMP synthase [Flavobacteriaceae bacterium]
MVDYKYVDIINILSKAKTILYPTDTVWGLGCDATDEVAVSKIYKVKQRAESKSLIILVSSIEMLKKYVGVPQKAVQIIENSNRPTTIIYKNPRSLANNVIAKDHTVAIRVVKDEFCRKLIQQFKKPIVSTSANVSGYPTPKSFSEITRTILEAADYIVNLQQDKITSKSSTILRIVGDEI